MPSSGADPRNHRCAHAYAVPRSHTRVFILHHILAHVELTFGRVFSRRFWSEDLPDAWRLYRALSLLLSTRSE